MKFREYLWLSFEGNNPHHRGSEVRHRKSKIWNGIEDQACLKGKTFPMIVYMTHLPQRCESSSKILKDIRTQI